MTVHHNMVAANVYDAIVIGTDGFQRCGRTGHMRGESSVRLFGNHNIGASEYTNLQVAGQMTGNDETFIVQRWYARNNFPENDPELTSLFKLWANSAMATFVIGNRWQWAMNLFELTQRGRVQGETYRPSDPFPTVIPPRQQFSVNLDNYSYAIDSFGPRLNDAMRKLAGAQIRPMIWIHLEGVVCDTSLEVTKKIVSALLVERAKHATVEERIVEWLAGQIDAADPDAKAQLHAVRDGILEGRHRS